MARHHRVPGVRHEPAGSRLRHPFEDRRFLTFQLRDFLLDGRERGQLLSGGQRQRISIARAIIRDPRILILDEPTSAVDADATARVWAAIRRAAQGRTTLLITHDHRLAAECDRVITLR